MNPPLPHSDGKIRVLVVDDSAFVRRNVTRLLGAFADIEVVGTARNGVGAIEKVASLPELDVVVMDLEMPVMGGHEALQHLRDVRPMLPVVVFSTHSEKGSRATMEALLAGAAGYVHKNSGQGGLPGIVNHHLLPKLREVVNRVPSRVPTTAAPVARVRRPPKVATPTRRPSPKGGFDALVIGCSTGGPNALSQVIPALPYALGIPILVVQHMPPRFTRLLANRLDQRTELDVREATHGEVLRPDTVYFAPGGVHMRVHKRADSLLISLDDDPPVHSCRPAVDPLLYSMAEVFGGRVLAAILTGMGKDGAAGCRRLQDLGATVIAQDEATSVVWGMPRAVVEAGAADAVVPLSQVAAVLTAHLIRAQAGRRSA